MASVPLLVALLLSSVPPALAAEGSSVAAADDVATLTYALELDRQAGDRRGEATVLKELGKAYYARGSYRESIEASRQSQELAHEIGALDIEAWALVNLALALEALERPEQALLHYEAGVAAARAAGDAEVTGIALGNWARLLASRGEEVRAAGMLKEAVELARQADSSDLRLSLLVHLANLQSKRGETADAIARYRAALELARKGPDRRKEALILQALALELCKAGTLGEAIDLGEQALALAHRTGDTASQAETLHLLATLYLAKGDTAHLLSTAEQMRALAQQIADPALQESAVAFRARALLGNGITEAVEEAYRELLALARRSGDVPHQIEALQVLGPALGLRGDDVQAIQLLEELLRLAATSPDPAVETGALISLGGEYQAVGRTEEAQQALERGLAIAQAQGDVSQQGRALHKLGIVQLARGQVTAGIELLAEGLALEEQAVEALATGLSPAVGSPALEALRQELRETAAQLVSLAGTALGIGAAQSAAAPPGEVARPGEIAGKLAPLLERALAQARRLAEPRTEVELLAALARLDSGSGNLPAAIETASLARDLARARRYDDLEQLSLQILAGAATAAGDPRRAMSAEEDLLAVARRRGDRRGEAAALTMLAGDHLALGELARCLSRAEESWQLAQSLGESEVEGLALGYLTFAATTVGDLDAQLRWGEEARAHARRVRDPQAERTALRGLGAAHFLRGDFLRSIASCDGALAGRSDAQELHALFCLFNAYAAIADLDRAADLVARMRSMAEQIGDPQLAARAREAAAEYDLLAGSPGEAAQHFRAAAGLLSGSQDTFERATAEIDLASASYLDGDHAAVIDHNLRAAELLRTVSDPRLQPLYERLRAAILPRLSASYLVRGDGERALAQAQEAWEQAQRSGRHEEQAAALHELGHVHFAAGRRPLAERSLRPAVAAWEEARAALGPRAALEKAAVLDGQAHTYDLLQALLVADGRAEEALEVAERGRAQAFLESLAHGGSPAVPSLAAIRQFARDKQATLVEYAIHYDPDGILLPGRFRGEQVQFDASLYVWVVKPSGEIAFREIDLTPWGSQGSLARLVRNLRASLGGRGRGTERTAAGATADLLRRLHALLIEPIAQHLPTDPAERVVFLPQGVLLLVPFPALRDAAGRYLVEQHSIQTAPSLEALLRMPALHRVGPWPPEAILLAGNPTIAAEHSVLPLKLAPLPGAEAEARLLAEQLGAPALIGEAAAKAAVLARLPGSKLVHLATHGLLENVGDPALPGALVLAPSGADSGLLTAREILALDLTADLVVLSACDTGGGRITSDGMLGLSRALLSAGAANVLVTLWQVPDAPTGPFLAGFYRELAAVGEPAPALRRAMLAAIERGTEPRVWAAFTLLGGLP